MRLACERSELLARLAIVARGVSQRTTLQILSGILVRAEADAVELAATDMEMSLRVPLEATVAEPGATVVPGRLLLDIVRVLPEGEVTLEQEPGRGTVRIACGASEYTLHTQGAEDYPNLPEPSGGGLSLDAATFTTTVAHVARAASRDESRPVLTGVLVEIADGRATMAATDSYRLAVREAALPDAAASSAPAIVPARALVEASRILATLGADRLEMAVQENQVLIGIDGVWISARRIDGQFPNYRQLLPQSFEHEVTISRDELLDVIRRIALMAQRNAPLRLTFDAGRLTVSAQTQDVGEAKESIPVEYAGERLEIGFNPDFLRDGVDGAEGDDVRLKLISPLRPGLIEGSGGNGSWYLIMPIRLST